MKKIVLIFSVLIVMGCSESTNKKEVTGSFAHTVFFWLKNPESKEDRKAFETSLKTFINNSTYIQTKHIGVPAATHRDVNDNTYTYSLLLTFKDKETHDAYQNEPNHKIFLEESSKLWNKVVVYDSENILK